MGSYRVVEEIALADCALEIHGGDLADVFETAARALGELMVDPDTVDGATRHTVVLEAPGAEELLFDWLSELLLRKDRDAEVFTDARVRIEPGEASRLTGEIRGARIGERTARRADPKGVTLHRFALERENGGWCARVVLDL